MINKLIAGRLNRKNYLLTLLWAVVIGFIIGFVNGLLKKTFPDTVFIWGIIGDMFLALYNIAVLPLDVRRAHDLGWKGTWVILVSIFNVVVQILSNLNTNTSPTIQLLFGVNIMLTIIVYAILLFKPGKDGANEHGEPDTTNHLRTFDIWSLITNKKA